MWHYQNLHQRRVNHSGINLNAGKRRPTTLLHISWVLYLLWEYFNRKWFLETDSSHISWVFYQLGRNCKVLV